MSTPFLRKLAGFGWAVLAITVWSGSLVMLRLGVTTSLNAYDLTALRFGAAALILAPLSMRRGLRTDRLEKISIATMVITFGAPYVLLIALAMETAPAAAAGALNPGVMAISSILLSAIVFGDRLGRIRLVGLAVTVVGIALFTRTAGAFTTGHLILIATGFMWAAYSLIVRRAAIPALDATAIVAVGSAMTYLPVYLVALPKQIPKAPVLDIFMQTGFHGVLVSVLAIYAFNRSNELLGPVAGAALPALIPVVTIGFGISFLGETAGLGELISVSSISLGLALILAGKPAIQLLLERVSRFLRNNHSV